MKPVVQMNRRKYRLRPQRGECDLNALNVGFASAGNGAGNGLGGCA